MRHGETLGFYIPAQKRSRKAELEAMRAAAKDLSEMIASWAVAEDELMEEYKKSGRPPVRKSGIPIKTLVVDPDIPIPKCVRRARICIRGSRRTGTRAKPAIRGHDLPLVECA